MGKFTVVGLTCHHLNPVIIVVTTKTGVPRHFEPPDMKEECTMKYVG